MARRGQLICVIVPAVSAGSDPVSARDKQHDAPSRAWRLLSIPPLGGAAAAGAFVTRGIPLWVPVLLAALGVAALLTPPWAARAATRRTLPVIVRVVVRVFFDSPPV